MIVMKIGGSSLINGEKVMEVASLVERFKDRSIVLVVSALQKVTDMLLATGELAVEGKKIEVDQNIELLLQRHIDVASAVTTPEDKKDVLDAVTGLLDELKGIYHGILLLHELSPRSLDLISSFGERLSVHLVAASLRKLGMNSMPIDARTFVRTDDNFNSAIVDLETTKKLFDERVLIHCNNGVIPVIAGFVGSTADGVTTTIGRNGTDYTAAVVGYALQAEEVWYWKDVDGVLTTDPRICPNARVVPYISYEEAAELSYFGGSVIHPRSMQPLLLANIPIRLKNTFKPDLPGTLIVAEPSGERAKIMISAIDGVSMLTAKGSGLQASPNMIVRVLDAIARVGVNMYLISMSSSEYNVSIVVRKKDTPKALSAVEKELEVLRNVERSIGRIEVMDNVAIIACVGENLRGKVGVAGKIFSALGKSGINIIAIAQGSTETNISLVVSSVDMKNAVNTLHGDFEE